jgi:fatty-acyl-CoA synthase
MHTGFDQPTETLSELLAREDGDAVATLERDGERIRTLTVDQLRSAVVRTAADLDGRGVRPRDVVGVWLPNWTESLVWEFALAALGAATLGINTRYRVHELTHLLKRARPVGMAIPERFLDLDFVGRLQTAAAEVATDTPGFRAPWVAVVRGTRGSEEPGRRFDVGGGAWRAAPLDAAAPEAGQLREVGKPHDLVNYFTTSGSTGLPKLAGHDQRSVATHCENVARALDMRPGDCFLGVLPLSGVFGFNPALAMLCAGGRCLLEPVFDPHQVVADMARFEVTHVVGGDDMLGRLMDAWGDNRPDLRRLRRGGIADFVGRTAVVAEWAEHQFDAHLSGVYGSSELFALTAIWPSELPLSARVVGGGHVVSDLIEVRAVDPRSGKPSAVGTTGELQFRGYNVVQCYLGDGESAPATTADGWFRSGDLGYLTEPAGSFVYVCRSNDALRLRGFQVQPSEIEQFLMSHPKVAAARVVGVSADNDDVAVAYVTSAEGAEADSNELLAFCRERLAPFKVPAFLNVIDEFPVTTGTNGTKIRTSELRRWAAEQLTAAGRGAQT